MNTGSVTTAEKPRGDAFTALRMICCILVVYEHMAVLTGARLPMLPGARGRELAVDCFFILSGFWVTNSLMNSPSAAAFFKKRCLHILPLYELTILAAALVISVFSILPFRAYFTDPGLYRYLGANAVLMNFLHPGLPGFLDGAAVNGSLWTIKNEVLFYFLLPLLLFPGREGGRSRVRTGRRAAAAFVVMAVLFAVVRLYSARTGFLGSLNYTVQRCSLFFLCGMFWYATRETPAAKSRWWLIPAAAVTVLYAWRGDVLLNIALAPALMCLCRWFCTQESLPMRWPHGRDLSYPVYLIHYPVIQILVSAGAFTRSYGLGVVLMCVLIAAVSCGMLALQLRKKQRS